MGAWALLLACTGEAAPGKDEDRDSGDGRSPADSHAPIDTADVDTADPDSGACTEHLWFLDADGDGYGSAATSRYSCEAPAGFVDNSIDCDDTHPTANVGTTDRATDGVDTDCDGLGVVESVTALETWGVAGGARDHWLGFTIAPPTDLDGDMQADLVVAAQSLFNVDYDAEGGALVFRGPLLASRSPLAREAAAATLVAAPGDQALVACTPGDTDGDGHGEVLVGAPYGPSETGHQGVAYLARGPFSGTVSLPETATVFLGAYAGHYLGRCASPGDVDGDGLADVVLSAPEGGADEPTYGWVYVVRGPAEHGDIRQADMTLRGLVPRAEFGSDIAEVGDLDGDGLGDFAVSDRADGADGQAVFAVTEFVEGRPPLDAVAARLDFASGNDGTITYLLPARLGDVDGDGHDDVGLGQQGDGSVYWIVAGPLSAGETRVVTEDYRTALVSDNQGIESDLSVATGLGDFNDDGVDASDVAVGNRKFLVSSIPEGDRVCYDAYSPCRAGAVFLLGAPLRPGVYDLDTEADRIESKFRWAEFGAELAGGGDLDGDGVPDLAVGSPFSGWDGNALVGTVDVLFGGPPGR